MSDQLSERDLELLGEVGMDGAINTADRREEQGGSIHATHSNPLNVMAEVSVKMDCLVHEEKEYDVGLPLDDNQASKKRAASPSTDVSSDSPVTSKRSSKRLKTNTTDINTGAKTDYENHDKSSMSQPKKRAAPKKKTKETATKPATIGSEDVGNDENDEPTAPAPKKQRPTGKSNTTQSPPPSVDTTARNTTRKRNLANPPAASRDIPTSWDEADEADRMLVTMRERGEDWPTIRAAWKIMTGVDTAPSTLPNRYNRSIANMVRLKLGDDIRLLAAKKQAETNIWTAVSALMEREGTARYQPAFLEAQFKKFERLAAENGISVEELISYSRMPVNEG